MKGIMALTRDVGIISSIIKTISFILRKSIGFYLQRSIIVERDLEKPIQEIKPTIDVTFREATIEDLDKFKGIVSEEKYKLIGERLKSKDYECIIILHKGKIVFYVWMSFIETFSTVALITVKLDENEVYNFDYYTMLQYRGCKLGQAGIYYNLTYLKNKGYKKLKGVLLENNLLSRKVLHNHGYEAAKNVTLVKLFGLKFHIYSKAKEPLWSYEEKK